MTPAASVARARPATAPARAPLRQPIAPRRVSGPDRHPRAAPLPPPSAGRVVVRILDAPFLDRLIRGRTWIAIVAFALLGIVAMQVAILRLGASIGSDVTQIEHLTAQNELAGARIAALQPPRNIATQAAALGMTYPPAGDIPYLTFNPGDPALAARSMTDPTAVFVAPAAPSLTAPLTSSTTAASSQSPAPASATTTSSSSTTTAGATSTSATTPTSTTTTTTTPAASSPANGGPATGGATAAPTSAAAGGAVSAAGGASPAAG
jgi:hypothetical protein